MSFQKIHAVGRIGRDAELKFTAAGKPVTRFSLAVDVGWGEQKETQWWSVSIFGARAEKLVMMLPKGKQVLVVGVAKPRLFDGTDGTTKLSLDILAEDVVLLGGRGDNSQTDSQAQPEQTNKQQTPHQRLFSQEHNDNDDIPF